MADPTPKPKKKIQSPPQEGKSSIIDIWKQILGGAANDLKTPAPPPPVEEEEPPPPPPVDVTTQEEEPPPPPPPSENLPPKPGADQGLFDYLKESYNTPATPEEEVKNKARSFDIFPQGAKNAIARGRGQATLAEYIPAASLEGIDKEKIPEIARIQKELQEIPVNQAFQAFADSKNPSEAARAFASDPKGVMQDLFLTSTASMLSYGASRMVAGAAMGAGAGALVGGVGALPGAAYGVTSAMGATSLALEYSGSVLEQLQKEGVDTTNPDQLRAAFDDEELMGRIRSHAYSKSIPIALADLVTDGLAGKIIGKPARTALGKAGQYAGEVALQGVGGAGGEVGGEVLAGEPLQFGAIASEAVGEVAGAPVSIGLGAVRNANKVVKAENIISKTADTGNPMINAIIDNESNLKPNESETRIGTTVQGTGVQNQQGEGSVQPGSSSGLNRTQEVRGQENGTTGQQGQELLNQPPSPLNTNQNAIQEQETGGVLQRPPQGTGIEGSQRGGMEQGQQGNEAPQISEEEKVAAQETALQENLKAKRKLLQDRVHQLYSEWINGGQDEMPDDLRQAKKNLDALDSLTKQREERLAAEKEQENKNPGNTPGTPVTAKISSNPRYKAQQAVVDQAHKDVVDSHYDPDKMEVFRKETEKLNGIANELMRKQEVAAEKAASPEVVTTIAKLRAEFYKHMEQGAKISRKALNELLGKINEVAGEHKLTARQIRTLVNLVRRTNLNSKKHQDKFNNKLEQIATDADYAEQLDTAERLRDLIKKSTRGKQAKDVFKAAKMFSRIDPSELNDLGPYIGHAYDIVNHYKKPGGDAYAPTNASDIQVYAEETTAGQLRNRIDEVRDEFGFGAEVSDQDILDYLKNEEEGMAQEDPFAANADETKKKIIRDKLLKTAEYAQLGLKEADIQGKDHKTKSDLIARMDLSKLNNAQLVDYIRTVDDMTVNDDFSGTDKLAARATAIENAAQLRELLKGLKLSTANSFKQAVYSLPQIFKLVYSQSKVAAEAYRLSGLDGYFNSTARVENQEDQQNTKFINKFREFKKKYKDFDRAHTQVDASIFATLVRYAKGTDPIAALEKSKQNVETSIARLKSKKDHQAIAKDAEASYQKFKDAKSIDDVFTIMKKESPGAFAMWEFWKDSYKNDIMERLKKSSREFYNNDFVEEENYTPKKFVTLEGNIPEGGENSPYINNNTIGGRKASVTSQAATGNLRPTQSIDFNFYDNMFKGWRESLYQIETTKPQQILHEFLALPESAELLGGEENRQGILDTWKKSDDIARSYGGTTGNKAWNDLTSALKLLSNIKALGGIYQFPKQYLSVAVSTLGNLGKDAGLFFSTRIPDGADKLFDQYSIGNRGKRLAGAERGESRNHHLQSAYASRWLKTVGAVNGFSEKGAHAFLYALRKGDVSVAKRSWAAYYLQSLQDSGVDIKNINLAEEANLQDQEVRQKAAAYAEQKVKETQLTSNPEEQAQALKSRTAAGNAMKNMVIPFSSFSINTKVRIIEAFNQLRKHPGSTEAWKELGAVAAEVAVYNGVKTYLLGAVTNTLLKPAIESMFDVKGGGDPEKEKKRKQNQKFWSDIYKDVMPTSIGSAGTTATVEFANYVNYLFNNPHISFSKWKEKKKELFSNYSKEGFDYGLYGVYLDAIKQTVADTKLSYDIMANKPIHIQNTWGSKEHVKLSPREEKFMIWNTIFEYASDIGMMDADIFNTFQKTKRELLKRGKAKAQKSDEEKGITTPQ